MQSGFVPSWPITSIAVSISYVRPPHNRTCPYTQHCVYVVSAMRRMQRCHSGRAFCTTLRTGHQRTSRQRKQTYPRFPVLAYLPAIPPAQGPDHVCWRLGWGEASDEGRVLSSPGWCCRSGQWKHIPSYSPAWMRGSIWWPKHPPDRGGAASAASESIIRAGRSAPCSRHSEPRFGAAECDRLREAMARPLQEGDLPVAPTGFLRWIAHGIDRLPPHR